MMSLATLMRNTRKRADAIADLEEVRKVVFGDVSDESDVYADHDRACELAGKMRRAIEVLRTR